MCEKRFCKKIFWYRLAARSLRFFGNTLVKAGHLMRPSVIRHCAGSRPRDRYWRPRFRTIQVCHKDLCCGKLALPCWQEQRSDNG